MQEQFPELLQFYDNLSHTILRVDIIRYLFLYQYGGIYADMDVESLQPMDALLTRENTQVLLGFESYAPTFTIEISLMGSVPKHTLWLNVIYQAVIADADAAVKSIFNITGNQLFTRVVQQELLLPPVSKELGVVSGGIQVLNQEVFYPPYPMRYTYNNEVRCRCGAVAPVIGYPCHACSKMYPDSYTLHHETGSWLHSWNQNQNRVEISSNQNFEY